mgnify:CR=1 FL=1
MSNFNKTLQALSVIQSELDVLKYELFPSDWAVLSSPYYLGVALGFIVGYAACYYGWFI